MKRSFKTRTSSITLFIIAFSIVSLHSQSYEAMSESDLDGVSAQANINILNIYGAPSAGLSSEGFFSENNPVEKGVTLTVSDLIRGELNPEENSDDKKSTEIANKQIRFIEDQELILESQRSSAPRIDEDLIKENIEASKQVVLTNESPNSNSETTYIEGNHNIVMQELENGVVHVVHDVLVDLIKIENLTFDDNANSIGNIYLTDVKFDGSTKTFIHD